MALGPCTFGFMMPLLAIIFQLSSTNFMLALMLGLAFAFGHIAILIFAGIFTNTVQKLLKWDSKSKSTKILKKICGVLVGLSGAYLIFSTLA
jgi:cytochrome c-type biogenesis protein